ncbi:TPA: hypothetical protein ACK3Q6_004442 [Burkholderia cepacia]
MTEEIQRLNYCAHAIDHFRELIPNILPTMPGMRAGYKAVTELLSASVKYLLPNCAQLIEISEVRQVHIDSVRLPYPVVALEIPWILPDGEGGDKGALRAPKRIALCVHLDADIAALLPDTARYLDEEGGGVCVIPVYWVQEQNDWKIGVCGAFLPYSNDISAYVPDEADEQTRLVNEPLREAGLTHKKMRQFGVGPFLVLPELFEHHANKLGSEKEAVALALADVRDEILALIQTGCVVNCANITTPIISSAAKLNRKREQAGRTPFFEYRVLAVAPPRQHGDSRGGTHASPKTHLRTGHIRRLENKTVWVSSTIVNAGSERGVVAKDYAVRPLRRPT